MRFLHTMVRVRHLEQALDFYCHKLGLLESQRYENEAGRFTLVYLYPTFRTYQKQFLI